MPFWELKPGFSQMLKCYTIFKFIDGSLVTKPTIELANGVAHIFFKTRAEENECVKVTKGKSLGNKVIKDVVIKEPKVIVAATVVKKALKRQPQLLMSLDF